MMQSTISTTSSWLSLAIWLPILFGVLVLAGTTGLGGGFLRDVLIDATPPAALADWRYLLVPVLAGLLTFAFHPAVGRAERVVTLFDAAGTRVAFNDDSDAGTDSRLTFRVPSTGTYVVMVSGFPALPDDPRATALAAPANARSTAKPDRLDASAQAPVNSA